MDGNYFRVNPRTNKRKPVTLIVGIVCKDQIVVASDSRTSFGTHVQDEARKIRVIKFMGGKCLIAQSGFTDMSGHALDALESRLENFEARDYRAIPELAQAVFSEIFYTHASAYNKGKFPIEQIQKYLQDNMAFNWMLAFFYESKPYLYVLRFPLRSIERIETHYCSIGSGGDLGAYLLKSYTHAGMDSGLGIAVSIYVVEAVGKEVSSVGGPTVVGIVKSPSYRSAAESLLSPLRANQWPDPFMPSSDAGRCYLLSEKEVQEISAVVAKVDATTKRYQNKKLQRELQRQSQKYIKELERRLYKPSKGRKNIKR